MAFSRINAFIDNTRGAWDRFRHPQAPIAAAAIPPAIPATIAPAQVQPVAAPPEAHNEPYTEEAFLQAFKSHKIQEVTRLLLSVPQEQRLELFGRRAFDQSPSLFSFLVNEVEENHNKFYEKMWALICLKELFSTLSPDEQGEMLFTTHGFLKQSVLHVLLKHGSGKLCAFFLEKVHPSLCDKALLQPNFTGTTPLHIALSKKENGTFAEERLKQMDPLLRAKFVLLKGEGTLPLELILRNHPKERQHALISVLFDQVSSQIRIKALSDPDSSISRKHMAMQTPFHTLVEEEMLESVTLLYADLPSADKLKLLSLQRRKDYATPLFLSCQHVNPMNQDQWSHLMLDGIDDQTMEWKDLWLMQTRRGETVLGMAALSCSPERLRNLLSRGASVAVNLPDEDGDTPLFFAAKIANHDNVETLLAYGADPLLYNRKGERALSDQKLQRALEIRKVWKGIAETQVDGRGRVVAFESREAREAKPLAMIIFTSAKEGAFHIGCYKDYLADLNQDYRLRFQCSSTVAGAVTILNEMPEDEAEFVLFVGHGPGEEREVLPNGRKVRAWLLFGELTNLSRESVLLSRENSAALIEATQKKKPKYVGFICCGLGRNEDGPSIPQEFVEAIPGVTVIASPKVIHPQYIRYEPNQPSKVIHYYDVAGNDITTVFRN